MNKEETKSGGINGLDSDLLEWTKIRWFVLSKAHVLDLLR
jgi:hypothetical protein